MDELRAVVFDWRGTLVATLSPENWVRAALRRLCRDERPETVANIWTAIEAAAGEPDRLDAPGVDCDVAVHRATYHAVFSV